MRRRSGFTLVELMVAMALIMFIMAILSEAFSAAMKSFRDLKATADMAERLRAVNTLLRRELAADHFDGRARMSQLDFWRNGPRPEGFFRLYQGSAPVLATAGNPNPQYCIEGDDTTELAAGTTFMRSFRATNHMLHFTVKLRGNERGDFFSAGDVPAGSPLTSSPLLLGPIHYQDPSTNPNVYNSQWAEVVYFLRQISDSAGGTPLYALYRRQFLLVPENGVLTATVAGAKSSYPEMSCLQSGGNLYFNSPRDVTMPVRRMGMSNASLAGLQTSTDPITGLGSYPTMAEDTAPANTFQSADLLLTDVVSFECRMLFADGNHFESLYELTDNSNTGPRGPKGTNTAFPMNNNAFNGGVNGLLANPPTGPLVFDTWSAGSNSASARWSAYDYSGWNVAGTASSIPIYQRTDIATGKVKTIQPLAVQVVIRVWDVKTQQTRQITIIQDL